MALTHTTARRSAIVNNETAAVDAGAGVGNIVIYSGAAPGAGNAPSGTLLCTVALPKPSFPTTATGAAALNGVPLTGSIVASGSAGYYRVQDSTGAVVHEGTVGTSGTDLVFSGGVSLVSGGTVTISSYTINGPN